jgi:hypothetical protein
MKCHDYQEALLNQLDDVALAHEPPWQSHLDECVACREWNFSLRRFHKGLGQLDQPAPSPDLSARIVVAVLADARKRRANAVYRAGMLSALAASALLMLFATDQWRPSATPLPLVSPKNDEALLPHTASLRDSVTEAGTAVASLTRRTADEVMDHGKVFLDVVGVPPAPESTLPPSPMGPPARSLATAGQAIGVGLEPVAKTARRAWDLLIRDVPMPPDDKPGL